MSTATTLPFQRHATLGMSVLVLNRSFVAVHVTNVRRALALLFRDVAEVVHIDQGHFSAHSIDSWRELSALETLDRSPGPSSMRGARDRRGQAHRVAAELDASAALVLQDLVPLGAGVELQRHGWCAARFRRGIPYTRLTASMLRLSATGRRSGMIYVYDISIPTSSWDCKQRSCCNASTALPSLLATLAAACITLPLK